MRARMLVVRPEAGLEDRSVRDLPDPAAAGRRAGAQRHQGDPVPALRPSHARGYGRARRDHAAQARGRRPLARLRAPGQEARTSATASASAKAPRARPASSCGSMPRSRRKARAARWPCASPSPAPFLDEAIARLGELPLPPYIAGKRPTDDKDRADYQTVYARDEGAVAAPTAGLHFTDELFRRLDERGVSRHFVTLHVGAGTFLPVKADDTAEHRMHAEWGSVSAETARALNAARARGGRIVAVGTTSLRLLESAARRGRHHRAVFRRYGDLHHAGLSLQGGGRADDQFPPAALDPVHAGFGLCRAGAHESGLCPCGRDGLSLLLLWRCESAVSR